MPSKERHVSSLALNHFVEALEREGLGPERLIAGTALRKERDERYPTGAALVDDVRRHLGDRPILARPPRPGYVLARMVLNGFACAGPLEATRRLH